MRRHKNLMMIFSYGFIARLYRLRCLATHFNILGGYMWLKTLKNRIKYHFAVRECDRFFRETDEQQVLFTRMINWCETNRQYRPTYRPDERTDLDKILVKDIINSFGAKYITIAMISGSIGYHSHRSAQLTIKALYTDECYTCERNSAVFQGDLVRELIHDLLHIRREKDYPKDTWSYLQLIKLFRVVDQMKDWDTLTQMGFSCIYPTGI